MNDFSLHMPVRVISGKNCVCNSSALLASFGKKALIITGKSGAKKSGALLDVEAALTAQGTDSLLFDKVGENPLLSVCREAGKCAADFGADFLIAVGGGSVLDAAKAAAIFATNRFENAEDIYTQNNITPPLPLTVIGTTAGTGSEVSKVAVITVDTTGEKRSISRDECYAALALCDPKYTYRLPRSVTVSTALDAFAHATEAWFSKKRNTTAEVYARACLPEIFGILKTLARGEALTEAQRDTMYYCSLCAGMCLCIGTTFPHLLGYTLTDHRGVPHGQACAVFDKALIAFCADRAPAEATAFFELLGAEKAEVLQVMESLIDIPESTTFRAEEIQKYSAKWTDDNPKLSNVCGGFKRKDSLTLFESFTEN